MGYAAVGAVQQKYTKKLGSGGKSGGLAAGFGDTAMTAMFIGLVSAYIGSYIGSFVSSEGLFYLLREALSPSSLWPCRRR